MAPLCGTACCVHAEKGEDGVLVTSTIPGNDGRVVFTQDEWDAFLMQVKDNRWDHTLSRKPVTV